MFSLLYRFVDSDLEYFSVSSAEQFEREVGDISGQIELNFSDNVVGFYDKETQIGNELILLWFIRLNEVLDLLENKPYVAMNIVENNDWIEYIKEGDVLKVNYIQNPSNDDVGFITDIPFSNLEKRLWRNVRINYNQYKNEIKNKSIDLLLQIKKLNQQLLVTSKVARIKKFYQQTLVLDVE
ncbi:hypothetical protein [Paenibacillus harenae]|uniref:hypothetical protein n=1 Tax=Paenibacillus harenae TaxID=306543 RepID=UPI00278D13BB|nr:hypothetical protein [Paenibacillus harenae]MDQ0062464.1 hypothetical protein [Paenibacillus harenae]